MTEMAFKQPNVFNRAVLAAGSVFIPKVQEKRANMFFQIGKNGNVPTEKLAAFFKAAELFDSVDKRGGINREKNRVIELLDQEIPSLREEYAELRRTRELEKAAGIKEKNASVRFIEGFILETISTKPGDLLASAKYYSASAQRYIEQAEIFEEMKDWSHAAIAERNRAVVLTKMAGVLEQAGDLKYALVALNKAKSAYWFEKSALEKTGMPGSEEKLGGRLSRVEKAERSIGIVDKELERLNKKIMQPA
jgi:hypothetical protein